MSRPKSDRLIEICFSMAAVIAVWQLKLPVFFNTAAKSLGASQNSILYHIVVNGGIPASLVIIAWISVKAYQIAVWPILPNSNYQKGWWIYSLIAQTDEEDINVVGYFYVDQAANGVQIREGHSFYTDTEELSYRGQWHSDSVLIGEDRIRLLFNMRAINAVKELPSQYDGFIELNVVSDNPKFGKTSWCGFFHDLGDRRDIVGPVYAERLKRQSRRPGDKIRKLIQSNKEILIEKARQKVC